MANKDSSRVVSDVGGWAKRCFFAGRALMEESLRPHGIGASQFYVLHRLSSAGPTLQGDLVHLLQVERATVSIIVAALVRKGLIEQVASEIDQRRKLLRLTPEGTALWHALPDLGFIREAAFDGISEADLETTARVLKAATERLTHRLKGSGQ